MEKLDILEKIDSNKMLNYLNSLGGFNKDIGIKIISISDGYAKAEIDIEERHLNPGKSVHGGCIFTLADTVGGCAAWTRGSYIATCSSSINYLNPAINTKKLIGIANEIKCGKNILVYDVEIYDEKDILIAKVSNSYYKLGDKVRL